MRLLRHFVGTQSSHTQWGINCPVRVRGAPFASFARPCWHAGLHTHWRINRPLRVRGAPFCFFCGTGLARKVCTCIGAQIVHFPCGGAPLCVLHGLGSTQSLQTHKCQIVHFPCGSAPFVCFAWPCWHAKVANTRGPNRPIPLRGCPYCVFCMALLASEVRIHTIAIAHSTLLLAGVCTCRP